jgi:alpha-ketoglutarate-dependent taurine dioxygenase
MSSEADRHYHRQQSPLLAHHNHHRTYNLTPLPLFGVEVSGIDLSRPVEPGTVEVIRGDVARHWLVAFRGQGVVSAHRQVEISRWFGAELDCPFHKHPASAHPEVFRVSNDEHEGCVGVGRTGWHIDGSFQECPYSHSLYHIISVPSHGDTMFTPLYEVVESLTDEQMARWDRLYMVADRRGGLVHPLVYPHPITHRETLCFHTGMVEAFVWDHGSPEARRTEEEETQQILSEIHSQIVREDRRHTYSHKWREGDFIVTDNLAVAHEASPDTQLPRSEVGLRVMHRTTVRGSHRPSKTHRPSASSRTT